MLESILNGSDKSSEEIPDYTSKDVLGLLVQAYREIENFNNTSDKEVQRSQKAQSLIDLVEAMCSVESKTSDITELLREKLLQIVDAIAMEFGGSVFLAPLDVAANSSLGSKKELTSITDLSDLNFLEYVWSTSSKNVLKEMDSQHLEEPKLSRSTSFQLILLSKRFKLLDGGLVKVPEGHFKLKTVLLVPVVVNKQSVALLGMANGMYTDIDGEILMEVLPKIWANIILESISKANKQLEAIERLRRVEERVENIKKLSQQLSNYISSNEDDDDKDSDIAKKKLKSIVNFFEEMYGGMAFVAPLKVESNLRAFKQQSFQTSSQSSESEVEEEKSDRYEFINYVFSSSAEQIKSSVMQSFRKPILKKAPTMLEVVKNRKPLYLKDTTSLDLPHGHFPMSNLLLIPISINAECVALAGLTNGKYDEFSGDILSDVLASSWFNLIQDIYSKKKLTENPSGAKKKKMERIESTPIIALKIVNIQKYKSERKFTAFLEHVYEKFEEVTTSFIVNKMIIVNDTMIAVTNKELITVNAFVKSAIAMMNFVKGKIELDFEKGFEGFEIGIGISLGKRILLNPLMDQYTIFGDGVDEAIMLANLSKGVRVSNDAMLKVKTKYTFVDSSEGYHSLKLESDNK
eukprot:gene3404-5949_t